MSENGAIILAAVITALGAIIAAIITVRNKRNRKEDPKTVINKENKVIVIPPEPSTNTNPFDLNPSEQEFGDEKYFEAIGMQLIGSRKGEDLHIKKISDRK